jgi:hypothetical protein
MPPWFRPMVAKAIAENAGPYVPPVLVEAEAPEVAA